MGGTCEATSNRIRLTEAVSHQRFLNEICLRGFFIVLTVIILVNSEPFNKEALPHLDNRSNKSTASSFSKHIAGSVN